MQSCLTGIPGEDPGHPHSVRECADGLAAPESVLLEKRTIVSAAPFIEDGARGAGATDGKEITCKKFNI